MSDTYNDMYGAEDEETSLVGSPTPSITLREKGLVKEMEIDGKKISVVDASVVIRLENTVKNLQTIIAKLENDLRNLTNRMTNAERRFNAINVELDNKVSYE
jgi:hypothetical protein